MSEGAPNMPQNLHEIPGQKLEIEEIGVYSWSSAPASVPDAKCTQVHLHIKLRADDPISMVTRFKSARALNEFIASLIKHRDHVWPEGVTRG